MVQCVSLGSVLARVRTRIHGVCSTRVNPRTRAQISPGVTETELLGHSTDAGALSGYAAWKAGELGGAGMAAADVAAAIYWAASQPPHVCIREIALAPTTQVA